MSTPSNLITHLLELQRCIFQLSYLWVGPVGSEVHSLPPPRVSPSRAALSLAQCDQLQPTCRSLVLTPSASVRGNGV